MHRDSVGTIIDFVKDVSEVLSEEQLIHFQDVVLVDLDQNQVRVPSTSLLQLPEPEASILIEELQRFFHSDILSLDSTQFDPFAKNQVFIHILDLSSFRTKQIPPSRVLIVTFNAYF